MTSYCDVTNNVYPVTMTTISYCSILGFGSGASNQAVAPGISRPLHATDLNPVVGLGLGGAEARLKRGPSDDVIIISQP